MAGGVGSRFWPASREEKPKQFLDMLGIGKSLLRLTYERFLKVTDSDKIFVVTNQQYKDLVKTDLPELSDNQIMGEPSRNNTGPCVAYAAMKVYDLDPDANLVIAPSDHFIADEAQFINVISEGLNFTASGAFILTLGMKPHRPDVGYGYIELGGKLRNGSPIHEAAAFKEKPDVITAEKYVSAKKYMWNSGIFLFSAKTILSAFATLAEDIFSILVKGAEEYNTDRESSFLTEYYPQTPSISIDYAIMEKADNVYCYPSDFGWTDLGTWGSLYDHLNQPPQANVSISGKVVASDAKNNMVKSSSDRTVILHGVDDLLIVEEDDLILIMPRDAEARIKQIRLGYRADNK